VATFGLLLCRANVRGWHHGARCGRQRGRQTQGTPARPAPGRAGPVGITLPRGASAPIAGAKKGKQRIKRRYPSRWIGSFIRHTPFSEAAVSDRAKGFDPSTSRSAKRVSPHPSAPGPFGGALVQVEHVRASAPARRPIGAYGRYCHPRFIATAASRLAFPLISCSE
jgi:hypothetical protein